MRVDRGLGIAVLAACLAWSACGSSDPPRNTPEGTAVAITRTIIARDYDAFERLMRNPNAALLEEAGARPRPGSFAQVLVREGKEQLRAAYDRAVAKNLGTGRLSVSTRPGPDGATEVTVSDDAGRALLGVLVKSFDGTYLGIDLRVY